MNFKFYLFPLLTIIGTCIFAQSHIFSVKDYGAVGDGYHDDYLAIQKAFDAAKNTKNSTISFEKGKQYFISKPLHVYNSINGNQSTLQPLSSQALVIISPNLKIENINISSKAFKFLRIDQDNTTINNCSIKTTSYFALLIINGNNFTLTNSSITNNFSEDKHYALHSTSNIQNIKFINNIINGATLFRNSSAKISGNILFKDNVFSIDYTLLKQDFKLQNDAFIIYGNSNILFINNKINALNVNRLFKISANAKIDKNKVLNITGIIPQNIKFENNEIHATASNGKQLFDFFIGARDVAINNNTIFAKGFTTLFENKTQLDLENREFSLTNNKIKFDSEILYFNGFGKNKTIKNSIVVKNNIFTYDAKQFIFKSKRNGQANDVKFNYVFNIRNVDRFIYDNNQLKESKHKLEFANRYFFYIYNPLITEITNSTYMGTIKLEPLRENSIITTAHNTILKSGFKKTITTGQSGNVKFKSVEE